MPRTRRQGRTSGQGGGLDPWRPRPVGLADKVDADEIDGTIVKEAAEIDANRVKTVTYTFDGTGPYSFACHEPGHFEAGMKGSIAFTN